MSVRMIGEELAREAGRRETTAGPAAAGAAAKADAAETAELAIQGIEVEAEKGSVEFQEELDQLLAGLSADVESALYTHPAVLEGVAFAVPDDRLG